MSKNIEKPSPENYKALREDIPSLLKKAKLQALKTVDNIRVQTYWQMRRTYYKRRAKKGAGILWQESSSFIS